MGETKRFADAIRRACLECRFGEVSPLAKPEREPTLGAVGSSLHLPFTMSTTSLQTQSSTAMAMQQAMSRVGGLKRPQSMQSLAQSGRVPAPISRIARALASTMSLNRPTYIPHELLVLSTLLTLFLFPQSGSQAENEQATAVETFEYIVRTWKASSAEVSVPISTRKRMLTRHLLAGRVRTLFMVLQSRFCAIILKSSNIRHTVLAAVLKRRSVRSQYAGDFSNLVTSTHLSRVFPFPFLSLSSGS